MEQSSLSIKHLNFSDMLVTFGMVWYVGENLVSIEVKYKFGDQTTVACSLVVCRILMFVKVDLYSEKSCDVLVIVQAH